MKLYTVIARLFAGIMIITAWTLTGSPLSGVVFVLILTALSAVRYRVNRYNWLGFAEAFVSVSFALYWLPALLGLWLPLLGFIEDKWLEWEKELLQKDYEDRAKRLKLEAERETAQTRSQAAARIAEITAEINERSRIAQSLHDHVGHEISGALIALRTAVKLYGNNDARAGELLARTVARVESASERLRETVHNLKPSQTADISTLSDLCESFEFCEVEFKVGGDVSDAGCWELLVANLKEGLTNVSRHSCATKVKVSVDGNADYVRLTIADNGKQSGEIKFGLGLTGMKERVRNSGGTLTVGAEDGFKIVCVIPKRRLI